MTEPVLYDNDIVLKICAYDLVDEAFTAIGDHQPFILPAARFSLEDQARRSRRATDPVVLRTRVESFIGMAEVISPTDDEIRFAARLEEAALQASVQLDTGESQLFAVLIGRDLPLMLTGDKRAVVALHVVETDAAPGRIACLEQLMLSILETFPVEDVRVKVCAEPEMDKTLKICFACASEKVALDAVRECLTSYSKHLHRESGIKLVDRKLSAVIS